MDDADGSKNVDAGTGPAYESVLPAEGRDGLFGERVHTKRVLGGRQVQMFAIGATIGTVVFVTIGSALVTGGPLFLLLGYAIWCSVIYCLNEGQGEMVCYLPIESAFSRFAARWVDEAFGAATAWNYYLNMASLLCFEITAFQTVISFWTDLHPAVIPVLMLVTYMMIHIYSSRWFGEAEFWIVLGKVTLMLGLFLFTFVTMLGGNPLHDRYGFRYWKSPGPISNSYASGSDGGMTSTDRLRAFWSCLMTAAYSVSGPEFLSLIASETINPRKTMPRAFKTVFVRLILFFIGSALAVGVVVPYNDPILLAAIKSSQPGAARSPYVAAMTRLKIGVLPHIVNAGIATSIYSAGSAYVFGGSRTLHALALDGYAPKFLRPTHVKGVPWVAVLFTLAIGCLSFLQVSSNSSVVLNWFINLSAATLLVTWIAMSITYLRFYKAMQVAGIDRKTLPYYSKLQPYAAWYVLIMSTIATLTNGYAVFLKGGWSTPDFIFSYASVVIFFLIWGFFRVFKKTRFVPSHEADLTTGLEEVDEHEAELKDMAPSGLRQFWSRLFGR